MIERSQRCHGSFVKLAVGIAWKELITADQTGQSHRFAPQGVDHMAIINDVAAPLVTISPAARQGQQMCGPEVEIQHVIMQPDAQAVADQARWHGVENPPENEAARRRHRDMGLFAVRGAAGRPESKNGAAVIAGSV